MTSEPSARSRRRKRCAGPGQAPGGRSPGLVGTASGAYREDVVIVVAELLLGEEFQVLPLRVEAQGGLHRARGPSRGGGDERLVTRERRARMSRAPDASAGGFAGEGAGTRAGGRARCGARGGTRRTTGRGSRGRARGGVARVRLSIGKAESQPNFRHVPGVVNLRIGRANGQSTVRRFRSAGEQRSRSPPSFRGESPIALARGETASRRARAPLRVERSPSPSPGRSRPRVAGSRAVTPPRSGCSPGRRPPSSCSGARSEAARNSTTPRARVRPRPGTRPPPRSRRRTGARTRPSAPRS